ncbi:DJ-1/PfpI/YhbO family deglycase/protease [Arthrobacter halodurans]|uniref:DJ-1/PfpI/YhbO family deglycase/protease n=1 Tax=Arthrobacter halodurans TaxID=516699 RepID=A0ABV4UP87_9MICC
MAEISGKKILFVSTNSGVEQDELMVPLEELGAAGATVTVAAQKAGPIKTLIGDAEPGEDVQAERAMSDIDPAEFDLLVVPGGTLNADSLRLDEDAQRIVKAFASSGRPVASICHGPWLLIETGLAQGKMLTSYRSVRTDAVNAGAEWLDKAVVRCDMQGYTLVTSRDPGDLDAFVGEIKGVLGA